MYAAQKVRIFACDWYSTDEVLENDVEKINAFIYDKTVVGLAANGEFVLVHYVDAPPSQRTVIEVFHQKTDGTEPFQMYGARIVSQLEDKKIIQVLGLDSHVVLVWRYV